MGLDRGQKPDQPVKPILKKKPYLKKIGNG